MKRALLLIVAVAITALAVWIVVTGQNNSTPSSGGTPAPVGDTGTGDQGSGDQGGGDTGGDDIPIPSDAEEMTVVSIHDGDTLNLRDRTGAVETVRIIGVDTPEVYPVYECFGDEATDELNRLIPVGSTVRAATDEDPFDDYDRLLLYLWNDDGVFVNLALVEGGFAEAIRVAPNDAWYDELLDAEDAAARANLGMWGC